MIAHNICANSAHDPVCEKLMDAHDIYANSAFCQSILFNQEKIRQQKERVGLCAQDTVGL